MKAVRERLRLNENHDGGLTLIEVVVALLIFAIVAVGVAYSLTNVLVLTKDGRSRIVAANLAASTIDSSRSVENIFTVLDIPNGTDNGQKVINGVRYYVKRSTAWITSTDADSQCGAAGNTVGGSLEYKRVNVTVTWDGMRPGTTPVRSDTLIAPIDRINQVGLGTIVASVQLASGLASKDITVSATPSAVSGNNAAAITETILPTDAQGCSYILKVVPGSYDVKITRSGYIDVDQNLNSVTKMVVVTAGASVSAGFQFDSASTFTADYAAANTEAALIPTNMKTTFVSTYGTVVSTTASKQLHPFPSGYTAIAGKYAAPTMVDDGCLSSDPSAWPTRLIDGAIGLRQAPATASPGGLATADVSLGFVNVTGVGNKFLSAVQQASALGTDDPGCELVETYRFAKTTSSSVNLGLPYGSWLIYQSSNSNSLGSVVSSVSPIRGGLLGSGGTVVNQVVTLDPRVVTP